MGAQTQDQVAGPASLRGGVGAEAAINWDQVGGLAGAAFQAVRQDAQKTRGRNWPDGEERVS